MDRPVREGPSRPPARRHHRLIAAFAAALALGGASVAATDAGASVWTIGAGAKAFPRSATGANCSISLQAAANEYEAAQIVLKGAASRSVQLSWTASSASLLKTTSALSRVGYVNIRTPSSGTRSRPGRYPDPLLPAQFGKALTIPSEATAFYVLFHVPKGTAAGVYRGGVEVRENGQLTATVPVELTVWDFELPDERVDTCFPLNSAHVRRSLRGSISWSRVNQRRVFDAYYKMFKAHGIAPAMLNPIPMYSRATGHADVADLAPTLAQYLDAGPEGPGFTASRIPWEKHWPVPLSQVPRYRSKVLTYLTDLCRFYKANGWQDKMYAWLVDEPSPGAAERRAEYYAKLMHKASSAAGFRARALLTVEPRPRAIYGRPSNSFLFGDIDIWAVRVFRFWDNYPAIKARLDKGDEVWLYTYAFNPHALRAPTFLIDESLADEHAVFWMMWRWKASGLLYWASNRWTTPYRDGGFRDPYLQPLSFRGRRLAFNGEASLIYPGYEPRLGLRNPYAPPVSSLRFEALRDGIEEYAYLQYASSDSIPAAARAQLSGVARELARAAASFPAGYKHRRQYNMPEFRHDAGFYSQARRRLGTQIELAVNGRPLTQVSGRVVDAASGRPVKGARIGDGVFSVRSAADGSFRLVGLLPSYTISVKRAGYARQFLSGRADGTVKTISLRRL